MTTISIDHARKEVASATPMYWRIYTILKEEIRDGLYPGTTPLPSEAGLAERFNTSRITVRKALEMLKSEGYATTRRGVGTFAQANLPPGGKPRSFVMNLTDMWHQTRTELIEFGHSPVPAHIAPLLEIDSGTEVHKAVRLRSYKRQPIGLLTTYIRMEVARSFTRKSFVSAPLFTLFVRAGHASATARQRITARSADPFCATHLALELGAPVLCVTRVSRDAQGMPISYLRSLFRPDRYEIELDLEVDGPGQRAVWHLSDLSNDASIDSTSDPNRDLSR